MRNKIKNKIKPKKELSLISITIKTKINRINNYLKIIILMDLIRSGKKIIKILKFLVHNKLLLIKNIKNKNIRNLNKFSKKFFMMTHNFKSQIF